MILGAAISLILLYVHQTSAPNTVGPPGGRVTPPDAPTSGYGTIASDGKGTVAVRDGNGIIGIASDAIGTVKSIGGVVAAGGAVASALGLTGGVAATTAGATAATAATATVTTIAAPALGATAEIGADAIGAASVAGEGATLGAGAVAAPIAIAALDAGVFFTLATGIGQDSYEHAQWKANQEATYYYGPDVYIADPYDGGKLVHFGGYKGAPSVPVSPIPAVDTVSKVEIVPHARTMVVHNQ